MDNNIFIKYLKANNILLSGEIESKLCTYTEGIMNYESSITFYQLLNFVRLPNLGKITKSYIQRCFGMVAETEKFLELDYKFVDEILSSSQLDITSELEVVHASLDWVYYNPMERVKYAKDLLLKIRLPLLTDDQLDFVLYEFSSFSDNKECLHLVEQISANKKLVNWKDLKFSCTTRHCNQNKFDILAFGIHDPDSLKIIRLDENEKKLKCLEELPQMPRAPKECHAVYLKGYVYIFGCILDSNKLTYQIYSLKTRRWQYMNEFIGIELQYFSVCALIDDIYIIGGLHYYDDGVETVEQTDNCLRFTTRHGYSLKDISPMNEVRMSAAFTAFEGRVVVCGGIVDFPRSLCTNTVEVYDQKYNEWSRMAHMVYARSDHSLVAFKSKLFVFGGGPSVCEVYDSCCKKFVAMKSPPRRFKFDFNYTTGAILMESRIVFFKNYSKDLIAFYDIDKEQWSEETYEKEQHWEHSTFIRLPQI